jgi:hypothetical protein
MKFNQAKHRLSWLSRGKPFKATYSVMCFSEKAGGHEVQECTLYIEPHLVYGATWEIAFLLLADKMGLPTISTEDVGELA